MFFILHHVLVVHFVLGGFAIQVVLPLLTHILFLHFFNGSEVLGTLFIEYGHVHMLKFGSGSIGVQDLADFTRKSSIIQHFLIKVKMQTEFSLVAILSWFIDVDPGEFSHFFKVTHLRHFIFDLSIPLMPNKLLVFQSVQLLFPIFFKRSHLITFLLLLTQLDNSLIFILIGIFVLSFFKHHSLVSLVEVLFKFISELSRHLNIILRNFLLGNIIEFTL
mmetsp:Transcript_42638/g.57982  ORF Transcript_42638/g.57982 Transcript_42638/m.57982 type:complete len:219 (-) Transcript_42638:969-1625(-)